MEIVVPLLHLQVEDSHLIQDVELEDLWVQVVLTLQLYQEHQLKDFRQVLEQL
tara:strand:- start:329 stop:487 length:159 start_codon:yes stop_codon:yes gene_type:complete